MLCVVRCVLHTCALCRRVTCVVCDRSFFKLSFSLCLFHVRFVFSFLSYCVLCVVVLRVALCVVLRVACRV